MIALSVSRLLSFICLYFAAVGALPFDLPVPVLALTAVSCCLCCGCYASGNPGKGWKAAGLASLLLAFILCRSGTDLLCAAPPAALTLFLCLSGRAVPDEWSFRTFMKLTMPVAGMEFLLAYNSLHDDWTVMVCILLYFVSGVFFLRQIRLGLRVGLRSRVSDLGAVILLPAAAVVLCLLAVGIFDGFSAVFQYIKVPFALLIGGVVGLLGAVTPENGFQDPDAATAPVETILSEEPIMTEPTVDPGYQFSASLDIIWYIAIGVLALFVLVKLGSILIRYVKDQERSGVREPSEGPVAMEVLQPDSGHKQTSNRRRIRKTYEKYLRLLQSAGYRRRPDDASSDVCEVGSILSPTDDNPALRQIYLEARYNLDREVPSEDVSKAKNHLRGIKSYMNPKK